MKKILYFIILTLIVSCNNNSSDINTSSSTEMSDQQREQLLIEKKQRLEQTQSNSDNIPLSQIEWGDISFTPYIPPYPELGNEGIAMMEIKLMLWFQNSV